MMLWWLLGVRTKMGAGALREPALAADALAATVVKTATSITALRKHVRMTSPFIFQQRGPARCKLAADIVPDFSLKLVTGGGFQRCIWSPNINRAPRTLTKEMTVPRTPEDGDPPQPAASCLESQ
jgi:hypothetical protein